MSAEKNVPVQSVRKALELLEMIALEDPARKGIALTKLARRMEMRPNSTRNILKTMIVCGMVAQNADRGYVPGPKLLAIGRLNLFDDSRLERTRQALVELSGAVQEASVFTILSGGRRVVLARARSAQLVSVDPDRESQDIFALPTTRVLAAYASGDELAAMIRLNGWPSQAWDGIADENGLAGALRAIRKQGACVVTSVPQQTVAVAAPVLEADGALIGAVGIHAPIFRCPPERVKKVCEQLRAAAQRMAKMH